MPLEVRAAVTMLCLTQFFGWRADTVTKIQSDKVVVRKRNLEVQATSFKTVGPGGLPCGILSLSKRSDLFEIVRSYVLARQEAGNKLLFEARNKASEHLSRELRLVAKHFGKEPPTLQAHAFKRGTVSALKRMGMAVEDINLFVGWSLKSTTFETYRRFVTVEQTDRDFFHDVVKGVY